MWAIGVIIYLMISGVPPFDGDNDEQILESITEGKLKFDDEIWSVVSPEAKDLISKLLTVEDERLTPKEALKHPWFKLNQQKDQGSRKISSFFSNRLKDFHSLHNFKKCIFTFMATRA